MVADCALFFFGMQAEKKRGYGCLFFFDYDLDYDHDYGIAVLTAVLTAYSYPQVL